jgi:hypothetical protein
MTIEIELVREGRVILQRYSDPLSMNEIAANVKRLHREVLDKATQPVHTITDITHVTKLPSNMLSGGIESIRTVHPMGGQIIIVSNNRFLNVMAGVFKRLAVKYKVTLVQTLDAAWVEADRILAEEKAPVKV